MHDTTIKYRSSVPVDHEKSLFTEVLPSEFFFRTCDPRAVRISINIKYGTDPERTNLGDGKLKVLLRNVLPAFAKGVHTCGG